MKDASILIATDLLSDAHMVKAMLGKEFARIAISSIATQANEDFEASQPAVLILAFSTLELAERHYLDLYRYCQAIHAQAHRTIVLCDQHELPQTYQRCRDGRFDDYVLFWPMVHDAPRLPMAVAHALRDLAHTKEAQPAADMARQVHQLAAMQRTLESHVGEGLKQAEAATHSLTRMISDVEMRKPQDIGQRLRAARADVQTFGQWVANLQRQMEPQGACARSLNALADRFQPIVLIVDDNELERKLLGKVLDESLCELLFAESGAEALALLRKVRPDLILLDVDMPDIDGLETLRRLKQSPQLSTIPVVMVTGHSEKEMVVKCLQAGAVDFAVKPLERVNLLKKIRRYLQLDGVTDSAHANSGLGLATVLEPAARSLCGGDEKHILRASER
jgi:CheY-like chemotaxis protein